MMYSKRLPAFPLGTLVVFLTRQSEIDGGGAGLGFVSAGVQLVLCGAVRGTYLRPLARDDLTMQVVH